MLGIVFWLMAGNPAFAVVSVNPSSLPAGTLSVAYDETLTGSGGTGPYTFAVTSGTLPTGLSLDGSTGDLSGTPSAQGVYTFTIQATDSLSAAGFRTYTVSVGTFSLAVQPNTLPNGTQGNAYNQTLTAVGGNPPYSFTVSSGSLPTGLTLATGGALTGTPTGSGTATFIVQVQDPDGDTGYRTYNISIGTNSLTLAPPTLANGTQGTAYNQAVTASGGTGGPYTYSISSGSLPPGLSLNASSGAITGTPSSGGNSSFTIRAVDGQNNYGSQAYTLQIGGSSLTLNPASLPNGQVSTAYNQTVTASGGTGGPYTYSVTSGSLPSGLSLNASSGAITGTPSAGGSYTFNMHAVDGNNNFGDRSFTVNVGTNSLTVTPATLPNGTQSVAYNQTVGATGGAGPYAFAVTSGALPTGLSLNASSGVISGTPSASGPFNFTIRATDSVANTGSQPYSVTIASPPLTVNPSTLPNGTQGVSYNQTVTGSGGSGPYSYAVTSGTLPTGLSLNTSSGAITGTPSAAGNFTFTIQTIDNTSNTGSRAYTVKIGTNSLVVNPATLPNGTQNTAYSQSVAASGGTATYTYALTSGALPTGLSLNTSSGAITGTPTGSGQSSFTIQATDTNGNIGSRPYTVNIGTSSLTLNPASLPAGSQGTSYNQTVTATGGSGPYTLALISGSLPPGLTFNAGSGVIAGTPTGSGTSTLAIRATDANGNTGTRTYNLNIGSNSLTINPASVPAANYGKSYNQTLSVAGGMGPYTFSLQSGTLPPGLSLSAGIITGTPTVEGSFMFVVLARDANGNFGTHSYSLSTARPDPSADPDVRGLVASQAATTRRFTDAQTTNVMRRLETVHDGFNPCGFTMGISGSSITAPAPAYAISPGPISKEPYPSSGQLQGAQPATAPPACNPLMEAQVAVWAGGAVEFGKAGPNGAVDSSKFSTSGVTAGVDIRLAEPLIVGSAVGYGLDRTDIGLKGTISDSNTLNGMIYASFKPVKFFYLDALVGYGSLNFSDTRWVTLDNTSVTGNRRGNTWFGSVSLSYDLKQGAFKFSPYVRLDAMLANLSQYSEGGEVSQSLTFQSTSFSSTAGVIGLRGSIDVHDDGVIWTPNARVEYKRALDRGFTQSMFYNQVGSGAIYTVEQGDTTRDIFTAAIGVRTRFIGGATLDVEYGLSGTPSRDVSWQSQMLRLMAHWNFDAN